MPMTSSLARRRFLALAGAAALAQVPATATAAPRPKPGGYPFSLGVASGDPTSTGVVLWTRLAPEPFVAGGGIPQAKVPVEWQVATDERFRRIVAHGSAWAMPELAHSVHVEVNGLTPDREWFYRFRYRQDVSAVGRTRTTPPPGRPGGSLAFAFASCQDWSSGYYPSYRHMAEDDLDLVVHLGDYVYEGGIPADGGLRAVSTPSVLRSEPRDLTRWRMQYELYKRDPDLQAAHARFPWLGTWDEHGVHNDYAGASAQYEAHISALRAAAQQAWYEHQPVPSRSRVYRRLRWGALAQRDMLDGRQ